MGGYMGCGRVGEKRFACSLMWAEISRCRRAFIQRRSTAWCMKSWERKSSAYVGFVRHLGRSVRS